MTFAPKREPPKLSWWQRALQVIVPRWKWLRSVIFHCMPPFIRRRLLYWFYFPPFKKMVMPIVRCEYPAGTVNDVVGVQPIGTLGGFTVYRDVTPGGDDRFKWATDETDDCINRFVDRVKKESPGG